jgi:hypothetical protein
MKLQRPGYADVAATLALIIALGGTSYAVTALPRNSVGTPQLKAHAVTKAKLAAGLSIKGPRGAQGPAGPAGLAGATGPAGMSGVSGYEIVSADSGTTGTAKALCPAGKRALGGGGFMYEGIERLYRSFPLPSGAGWEADGSNFLTAYAICAFVT